MALSDGDYLDHIVAEVNRALVQVLGTVYTMDDPTLIAALIGAKERGVEVQLCADGGQFFSPSSSRQPRCMTELIEAGIKIKTSIGKTTHQKTWLIDDSIAFIGSGNATYNSRCNCTEFGIETFDPDTVKTLHSKIDKLWEDGRTIELRDAQGVRSRSTSVRR